MARALLTLLVSGVTLALSVTTAIAGGGTRATPNRVEVHEVHQPKNFFKASHRGAQVTVRQRHDGSWVRRTVLRHEFRLLRARRGVLVYSAPASMLDSSVRAAGRQLADVKQRRIVMRLADGRRETFVPTARR